MEADKGEGRERERFEVKKGEFEGRKISLHFEERLFSSKNGEVRKRRREERHRDRRREQHTDLGGLKAGV